MVFSSLTFLCIFLPAVFLLYGIIPSLKARNIILMLASLVFYAYGEPVYVLLMIGSSLCNYCFARLVAGGSARKRKAYLVIDLVINLGLLCVFKYTGMIIASFNSVFGIRIPDPQIVLPIGISFFTFQALSYVIDVYRGKVKAQRNYLYVQLYIAFFPQLIAGPIVRYKDIEKEILERSRDMEMIANGLRRFIGGLGKKVLIANAMGQAADAVFSAQSSQVNILSAWIGAVAYLFQIYYDFSGYSDMAIGLGQMFGFHFLENFQYPYGAFSIQEFWRRWHISLSTWFREYLYIPLGGNRKGRPRTVLNKLIVFFCTGLWHGASWTFVFWGLYHGFFLLLEEYVPILRRIPKWLGRVYTLLVVCVGFVFFRADTLGQGFSLAGKMFSGFDFTSAPMSLALRQLTPWFLCMLVLAVIGCAPIRKMAEKIRNTSQIIKTPAATTKNKILQAGLYAGAFLLLAWCMLRLSGSGYNPVIYFKF